jgi:enterochelin esterase-like enzyme
MPCLLSDNVEDNRGEVASQAHFVQAIFHHSLQGVSPDRYNSPVMRKPYVAITLCLLNLVVAGCDRLQPGYYLTPGHLPSPTSLPTGTLAPTLTLPSTRQVAGAATATGTPSPTPVITPTPTPFVCVEEHGQIVQVQFFSATLQRNMGYRIYLPPCYSITGRRYPYLIIMHGLVPGTTVMNDDQWDRMGLDEAADKGYRDGTLPPMIIVMPNGNDARHGDDTSPFPIVVVNDLMPEIEANYCTWNTSAGRAIGGLSRGAFWAYDIALEHPDLFDRVGGHSPFFYDGDYKQHNPYNLLGTVKGIERLKMHIDYGADDYVDVGVKQFMDKLQQNYGIVPELVVNSKGAHNEEYWSAHTADYLAFYGADWPLDAAQLPACDTPTSNATAQPSYGTPSYGTPSDGTPSDKP